MHSVHWPQPTAARQRTRLDELLPLRYAVAWNSSIHADSVETVFTNADCNIAVHPARMDVAELQWRPPSLDLSQCISHARTVTLVCASLTISCAGTSSNDCKSIDSVVSGATERYTCCCHLSCVFVQNTVKWIYCRFHFNVPNFDVGALLNHLKLIFDLRSCLSTSLSLPLESVWLYELLDLPAFDVIMRFDLGDFVNRLLSWFSRRLSLRNNNTAFINAQPMPSGLPTTDLTVTPSDNGVDDTAAESDVLTAVSPHDAWVSIGDEDMAIALGDMSRALQASQGNNAGQLGTSVGFRFVVSNVDGTAGNYDDVGSRVLQTLQTTPVDVLLADFLGTYTCTHSIRRF
jgi:hypothetical protein